MSVVPHKNNCIIVNSLFQNTLSLLTLKYETSYHVRRLLQIQFLTRSQVADFEFPRYDSIHRYLGMPRCAKL